MKRRRDRPTLFDSPTLEEGSTYEVMIRNVSRLLIAGKTLAQARELVFAKARVSVFPNRPAPKPVESVTGRTPSTRYSIH
jgi:hypothetical protein